MNFMKGELTLAPRNGLANRIRAVGSGLELARMLNFRLHLIWSLDYHLNCPYEKLFQPYPEILDVENYNNSNENLEVRIEQSGLYDRIILNKEVKAMKLEGFDFKELAGHRSLFISSGAAFLRKTPNWKFRPEKSLEKIIEDITGSYPKHTIGVHIRRGDNTESITHSPLHGFINGMRSEVSADPDVSFFLATDSTEEEENIRQEFPGRIITFPKNSLDRNDPIAIREAMVDLLCLSKTSKIIGSYWSSFSQLAAKIGKIQLTEIREGK